MQKDACARRLTMAVNVLDHALWPETSPNQPKAISMGPGDIPSKNHSTKAPFFKETTAVPPKVTAKPAARAAAHHPRRMFPPYCLRQYPSSV